MLERLYNDAQTELDAVTPLKPVQPAVPQQSAGGLPVGPVGATTQDRLAAARASLQNLEHTRTPEHPDVLRAKRVIADLEKQRALEIASAGNPTSESSGPVESADHLARRQRLQQMRAEIESLDRQISFKEAEERRLQAVVTDYQQRVEAIPGTESEWVALTRDYDTQQAAYKDLLSKSEQAKVASNLERQQVGEQFRILDPPRVPGRPIAPIRGQITAIGIMTGLVVGLVLAALIELRDSTFRSEVDIVQVLALPVAALVPYVPSDADLRKSRRRRLLISVTAGLALVSAGYAFWALKLWRFAI
jgi:uncharacterized protein involved in exopolysaccharide biosynthesis